MLDASFSTKGCTRYPPQKPRARLNRRLFRTKWWNKLVNCFITETKSNAQHMALTQGAQPRGAHEKKEDTEPHSQKGQNEKKKKRKTERCDFCANRENDVLSAPFFLLGFSNPPPVWLTFVLFCAPLRNSTQKLSRASLAHLPTKWHAFFVFLGEQGHNDERRRPGGGLGKGHHRCQKGGTE